MAPESVLMRATMLVVYMGLLAFSGLYSFRFSGPPFTDWMLSVGRVLFAIGSVIGVTSILTGFWWLERFSLLTLLGAIAFLAPAMSANHGLWVVVFLGTGLASALSVRFYAIRSVLIAPPRRRR